MGTMIYTDPTIFIFGVLIYKEKNAHKSKMILKFMSVLRRTFRSAISRADGYR